MAHQTFEVVTGAVIPSVRIILAGRHRLNSGPSRRRSRYGGSGGAVIMKMLVISVVAALNINTIVVAAVPGQILMGSRRAYLVRVSTT